MLFKKKIPRRVLSYSRKRVRGEGGVCPGAGLTCYLHQVYGMVSELILFVVVVCILHQVSLN